MAAAVGGCCYGRLLWQVLRMLVLMLRWSESYADGVQVALWKMLGGMSWLVRYALVYVTLLMGWLVPWELMLKVLMVHRWLVMELVLAASEAGCCWLLLPRHAAAEAVCC
jgi:hypothetical protein